jgi:hypothetical protein
MRLPAIIPGTMILQAEVSAPIWGRADPDESVEGSFARQWGPTQADRQGKQAVDLPFPGGHGCRFGANGGLRGHMGGVFTQDRRRLFGREGALRPQLRRGSEVFLRTRLASLGSSSIPASLPLEALEARAAVTPRVRTAEPGRIEKSPALKRAPFLVFF